MNAMNDTETKVTDVEQLPLKALGLKAGMALQTRRLVEGATKSESQYYGAIEGKGVMVAALGSDGAHTGLNEGEICVVRGFTGQYEFSFISKVLQTFEKPFVYALLAYPPKVDARKVRQSMRTKVSWPCAIVLDGKPQDQPGNAVLVDLSPFGAMIRSDQPLGAIGHFLSLTIFAEIDQAALQLRLRAKICHSNRATQGEGFVMGMAFNELSRSDHQWLLRLTQQPSA